MMGGNSLDRYYKAQLLGALYKRLMSQDSLKTGSIGKFQLTASIGSNSVDLSTGITDFRLYESVLSNTVTATAVVVETGTGVKGSIDGLPIRGGENLKFKIKCTR